MPRAPLAHPPARDARAEAPPLSRRGLLLGLFGAVTLLAAAASGLLARFYVSGEGAAAAAAAVLALTAAVLGGERLAGAAQGGALSRLRAMLLPWLMLAFVMNGGVRTWTIAQELPTTDAVVAATNTLATVFAAALAAMLIGPTLERLASAVRAEGEAEDAAAPVPARVRGEGGSEARG